MLDEAQRSAVETEDGPTLVVASPGSGKTTVIIERLFFLIRNKKIDPKRILVITFTKDAALSMKNRFETLDSKVESPVFGTFHSIFFHILSEEKGYTRENILIGEEKKFLIKKAFLKSGIYNDFFPEFYSLFEKKMLRYKLNQTGEFDEKGDKISKIIKQYESLKEDMKYVDFGDMINFALKMFQENPNILSKWQKRFDYILVDEAQDMNDLQFSVIKMLSGEEQNIFAVGDEDQSIYGFRGANPKIMLDFEKTYPDCKIYKLEKNYRSLKEIVEISSKLISNNKSRFDKNQYSAFDAKARIEVHNFIDSQKEAKFIVQDIKKQLSSGIEPKNIAVLYRNNIRANRIVNELVNNRIPVNFRRLSTDNKRIVSDIISVINIATGIYQRQDVFKVLSFLDKTFYRKYFTSEKVDFSKILMDSTLITEERKFLEGLQNSFMMMQRMKPFALMVFLRKTLKYDEYLKRYCKEYELEFDYFLEIVDSLMDYGRYIGSISDFRRYVEENTHGIESKENGVNLRTFHGAKGLEYNTVYIIDANDGITPANKSMHEGDIEEERRMFYVAITRAKRELIICFTESIGERKYKRSRFIDELEIL
ncbi:MAG: ATP-dependent helicase [Lachnospiraceae bacterium]|nr:ATP-dependent helicase [Lachnospiraceae bacterium]